MFPTKYDCYSSGSLLLKPSSERAILGARRKTISGSCEAWWETDLQLAGRNWTAGSRYVWVPYAMGGGYAPYYADFSLTLNWASDGEDLKRSLGDYRRFKGFSDQWTSQLNAYDKYFLPGITWSSRPNPQGSFWAMPQGCIFRHSSPAIISPTDDLVWLLGVLNSRTYRALLDLLMPRGATSGQSLKYELTGTSEQFRSLRRLQK